MYAFTFSPANKKLRKLYTKRFAKKWLAGNRKIYSFDLPAGYTCPFAKDCFAKVVNGKIKDGPDTLFRCYAASDEVRYPVVHRSRQNNLRKIRKSNGVTEIRRKILANLPKDIGICRIHSGGDFHKPSYFHAWLQVAKNRSDILFYAYTKALGYWATHKDEIPSNLVLTASKGGKLDSLIDIYGFRSTIVVGTKAEAKRLGLQIDESDHLAADPAKYNQDFALLVHGIQPAGSEWGKLVRKRMRK